MSAPWSILLAIGLGVAGYVVVALTQHGKGSPVFEPTWAALWLSAAAILLWLVIGGVAWLLHDVTLEQVVRAELPRRRARDAIHVCWALSAAAVMTLLHAAVVLICRALTAGRAPAGKLDARTREDRDGRFSGP